MQGFITFIVIIIIFVLVFSFSWGTLENAWESLQTSFQEGQTQTGKTKPSTKPSEISPVIEPDGLKPDILIDTLITSGPEEGEIIENTSQVIFEFEEKLSLKEIEGTIIFETKIEGFDEDWTSTYSKKRTVKLPNGAKEYKFLVRTRIKDSVDPTPATITFKINTSPYFGKIKISSIQSKTSSRPAQITLSSHLDEEEKINITNWSVKGNKGEIIIPQAIKNYQTYASPANIFVRRYEKIYLLSDSNPLGKNKNFRLNFCFNYLLEYYEFSTTFPKNCPKPEIEEISFLDEDCQEFILDLSTCEIPEYQNNLKILFDMECRTYMDDHFNYNACFKNHQTDEDFLENYWYIYLNRDIVRELHDTLILRDRNGLLVDKYLY